MVPDKLKEKWETSVVPEHAGCCWLAGEQLVYPGNPHALCRRRITGGAIAGDLADARAWQNGHQMVALQVLTL